MVPISKWLKHLNTVLHTTGHRGHYHQDGWRVSGELGGDGEGLWNREDSLTPPETGWWYWAGTWIEDTSMVVRKGVVETCEEARVVAAGEAAREQGIGLGRYLSTGRWSEGRPVYLMKGGSHVLSFREGALAWDARDPDQASQGWIYGGQGIRAPGKAANVLEFTYTPYLEMQTLSKLLFAIW